MTATITEVEPSLAAINGVSPTSACGPSAAAPGAAVITRLVLIGATTTAMGQSQRFMRRGALISPRALLPMPDLVVSGEERGKTVARNALQAGNQISRV